MTPHYLRIAQALAFVSSTTVGLLGCGSRVIQDDGSKVGSCTSLDSPSAPPVGCSAGGTCTMTLGTGAIACQPAGYDAGYVTPTCGQIQCGTGCSCQDAGASTCGCTNIVIGPLPPPDLIV